MMETELQAKVRRELLRPREDDYRFEMPAKALQDRLATLRKEALAEEIAFCREQLAALQERPTTRRGGQTRRSASLSTYQSKEMVPWQ